MMKIQKLTPETKQDLLGNLLKRNPGNYGAYEAGVREILRHVFFDAQAVHGVCKGHARQLFHLAALCQRAFACLLPDILQRLFCGCAALAQGLVAGHGREQLPLQVIADGLAAPVVGALQVWFCIQDCGRITGCHPFCG